MKKILITKEKHGDWAYDISTKELSDKVYLQIFNDRKKEHYYDDYKFNYFFDQEKFKNLSDGKIARTFILQRSENGYEYEEVEELFIQKV